ncbi:protein NO VEIN domain-containing protein [Streptomyces sp. NPDC001312]|uniref:protein NO VEIN domain-containing protein n=1 Tax=Streptomyces sp. NPDC001312 TaxID=3364561 RepID=UPI00368EBAC4
MPVPPDPVLRAAVRWLERLPASGAARIRALFTAHSDYSDITPTQYDAAYEWLRQTGLLDNVRSRIPAHRRVFDAAIAHSGALWLPDTDLLVRGPDELPDDALRTAEALGLSESEAYTQIAAVWGKVDAGERARIGAAGELALVELLTASVDARVEHVAAWADGYGYDIAVHSGRHRAHLEAKATVRRGRLTIYLSRNEYETLLRDPAWELVAVRLTPQLELDAVATVPKEWITSKAPADRSAAGRWESCRLDVPPHVPVPGIPSLAPMLAHTAPALLNGSGGWPGQGRPRPAADHG